MEQKETVKKASRMNIEDVQKRNREYDSLRGLQAAMTGSKVEIHMLGAKRPHPYTQMLAEHELRNARTK